MLRPAAAPGMSEVVPPTSADLRILRDEVDPGRVYLKAEEAVSGLRR